MKMMFALVVACLASLAYAGDKPAKADVARGKYLIETAGCNDCHTPNYAATAGQAPESEWLVGDAVGWQGPWGTTYAPNLRLYMKDKTEAQWVQTAKNLRARPPMPWFNVARMNDADLKAIYRYVKSLPVTGSPAPEYQAPGIKVAGPVVVFP